MKQIIIIVLAGLISCTSRQKTEQQESKAANIEQDTMVPLATNRDTIWNADETTKKHVSAMLQFVNDSSYQQERKRKEIAVFMQNEIDALVKECSMKGEAHDALHAWLEKVLKDVKELKEDDDEFSKAYAALKKDLESFNLQFR